MSLTVTASQVSYNGNGAQTVFPTTFKFLDNSNVLVEKKLNGGTTFATLTEGAHYNLAGAGVDAGGNVTMLAAPAAGDVLRITRNTPRTQPVAFRTQGQFLAETHETAFDREEMQIQELERRVTAVEAAGASVVLAASKVVDTFVVADPVEGSFPRVVACAGTPSMVLVGRVEDLTDPALSQPGLGTADISAVALNQFTVRHVPGLTPGHNTRITYLVLTI